MSKEIIVLVCGVLFFIAVGALLRGFTARESGWGFLIMACAPMSMAIGFFIADFLGK